MKLFFSLCLILFSLNAVAAEGMLQATEYKYVEASIGKGKPYFLEIGSESCHSCQTMSKMLYKLKQSHPEYNIYFIDVKKERAVAYKLGIQMIPTQIVYDAKGKEVFRHIGILSPVELYSLLAKYNF